MFKLAEIRQKYLSKIPALDADILLQLSCNKDKVFILSHPEHPLGLLALGKFFYYLARYRSGEPVAYLTGEKEFYNLNFLVNASTLIPRPDTEIMVSEALKTIESTPGDICLIDLGTGTGCIPIAILKNTQRNIEAFGVDISRRALSVAKKNSGRHGTAIKFLAGNLLTPILPLVPKLTDKKIIITANLPYLTLHQYRVEPSIRFEPRRALIAAENGLHFYRLLLEQLKNFTRPFSAFLEIDPGQTNLIKDLIYATFPKVLVEIKTDLAGRDRIVILHFS